MGFADLAKVSNEARASRGRTEGENVALQVTSYDLVQDTTTGIRIDTGDEVTIKLRPPNKPLSKPRGEPKFWSAQSGKMATQPGGVILFEGVYRYPEGLTARWGTSISHSAQQAEVFIAHAKTIVSQANKFGLEIVRADAATPVNSVEAARAAIIDAISHSKFASALVRCSNGKETYTHEVRRAKLENKQFVDRTPEAAADDFFATAEFGRTLAEEFGNVDPDFVAEVIAGERIYMGPDSQSKLGDKETFQRWNRMGADIGYAKAIIAVRRHPEGGAYFTHYQPTSTMPALYPINGIPSPNIQSTVPAFINSNHAPEEAADDLSDASAPSEKVKAAASALAR